MTNNRSIKRNYHVRFYLKVLFGFAGSQFNCTYGLGYKLTLQRTIDKHVLSHWAGANDAANRALAGRVIVEDLCLYVPHYAPKISNQKLMLGHTVSKAATELS